MITHYKLVDGVALIEQYLNSGFEPFGNPHIESNGRVLQVMILREKDAKQEKATQDVKAAKGK